ncbi:acyl-CoA thioesterase [Marinomonas pontica]|uniref:acyl-CoA thioesterase n=1 Tax=Marinomonas pontica TaxID=264739 RepID=UPI002243154D|nr:hotdog domain-containing protein [Marinomonas pontica]MCW8357188.1 acyl-CoA thioesterase [Marinomonas pontica]
MNKLLIQKREEISETRVAKMVFPATTNHYDTLFGGIALQWMDEVAYIAATRFSRKTMVTISTEQVDFKHPIPLESWLNSLLALYMLEEHHLKWKCRFFSNSWTATNAQKQ